MKKLNMIFAVITVCIVAGSSTVRADEPQPKDSPPKDVPPKDAPPKVEAPAEQKKEAAAAKPDKELEAKIKELIKKFSEQDSKTWAPARAELRQIGKPAVPFIEALEKDAETKGDRVVAGRAKSLIRMIANPPQPGNVAVARVGVGGGVVIGPGGQQNLVPGTIGPMGVTSLDLLESFGARLGESADGIRVTDLKAGSPADKAGLSVGDIIAKVNGRAISKFDEAKETLGALDLTKAFQLEVQRKDRVLTLPAPNP